MHLCMYEHDVFNQRNTPKTRLNEIFTLKKCHYLPCLPYLAVYYLNGLPDRTVKFLLQLIAYYVRYRIKHSLCLYGGL